MPSDDKDVLEDDDAWDEVDPQWEGSIAAEIGGALAWPIAYHTIMNRAFDPMTVGKRTDRKGRREPCHQPQQCDLLRRLTHGCDRSEDRREAGHAHRLRHGLDGDRDDRVHDGDGRARRGCRARNRRPARD